MVNKCSKYVRYGKHYSNDRYVYFFLNSGLASCDVYSSNKALGIIIAAECDNHIMFVIGNRVSPSSFKVIFLISTVPFNTLL